MPKKRSRRRREHRSTTSPGGPPAPPAAAPIAAKARRDISWTGLMGALLGFAPMLTTGIGILVKPPEDVARALALVPLLMAALFIPAAWASITETDQRRAILRVSAAASIVMAFAGGALLGPVIFVALLPATVLLWLASGGMRR